MSFTYIYFYCALQGDKFDPTPFLNSAQFKISDYHRPGDVGKRGQKDHIWEDGYVSLEPKEGDFEEFVKQLYSVKNLVIGNEADIRVVHIALGYEDQCNWEFDPTLLKMISELDLTLTITCVKTNENEDI